MNFSTVGHEGIDVSDRIMWYTPWPVDQSGEYRNPAGERECSEKFVISGMAVAETVEVFRDAGGDIVKLVELLNQHLPDAIEPLSPHDLLDSRRWYTGEFNLYLAMFTKKLLGDYSFHFHRGSELLSKYHAPYEKGFLEYAAWGTGEDGKVIKDQSSENLSNIYSYLKEHYPDVVIDEFIRLLDCLLASQNKRFDESYFTNPNYWHSAEFIGFFYALLTVVTNDNLLLYKTSIIGPSLVIKAIARAMGTPKRVFQSIVYLAKRYTTTTGYRILDVQRDSCRIIYYPTIAVDYKIGIHARNLNWYGEQIHLGMFRGIPSYLFDLPVADYESISLISDGDDYFEGRFFWQNPDTFSLKARIFVALLGVLFFLLLYIFQISIISSLLSGLLFVSLCGTVLVIMWGRKLTGEKRGLENKFIKYSQEKEDLARSLQDEKDRLEKRVAERTEELLTANKKLKELDRLKSNFFTVISHEFRTPLTLILGTVDKSLQGHESLSYLDHVMIKKNGLKLLQMINDLLELARLEAGSFTMHISRVDGEELVRHCAAEMESVASLKEISFTCSTDDEEFSIWTDRVKLKSIVFNLISNAVKFTGSGGRVDISARHVDGSLEIQVADTGMGIPEEIRGTIFNPFVQGDEGSGRRHEGTGIGLAIVREFTKLLGGTVSLQSRCEYRYPDDHGTVFTLLFTAGREYFENRNDAVFGTGESEERMIAGGSIIADYENLREQEEKKKGDEEPPLKYEKSGKLLLVDDNRDMLYYLTSILEKEYDILSAGNGREALDILSASEGIDLVVSDVMMPEMDGYELLSKIRKINTFRGLPVILVTAKASIGMKLEGLSLGATDYITKPFDGEELKARIANQLEIKLLRDRMEQKNRRLYDRLRSMDQSRGVSVSDDAKARLETVCEFIREFYYEDLSREALAETVEMNPDYFSRLFNKYTGKKLSDFINELRIDAAKKLLLETDMDITRIAHDAGFESLRTFNRVFKIVTGDTPGQFREKS